MSVTDENVTINATEDNKTVVDSVTNQLSEMLTTAGGVKPNVVSKINLKGFVTTCFATGEMPREQTILEGESLKEYRLDSRFAPLVLPRGVYADQDHLGLNLMCPPVGINRCDILSSVDFMFVQSQVIGALRQSESLSTNLLEASEFVTLTSALPRSSWNGECHYSGNFILPLELKYQMYDSIWYNYSVDDVIKEFIRQLIVSVRNGSGIKQNFDKKPSDSEK